MTPEPQLTADTIDAEGVALLLGVESPARAVKLAKLGVIPASLDYLGDKSPVWLYSEIEAHRDALLARRGRRPRELRIAAPFKTERDALTALDKFDEFDPTCAPLGRRSFKVAFSPGLEPWRKLALLRRLFPQHQFGYYECGVEPWDYQRLADPVDPLAALTVEADR